MKAITHTTIAALRRNASFTAAKAGDPAAALAVVRAAVNADKAALLARQHPDAVLLPVLAVERTGINMLPLAFVEYVASLTGLPVERSIMQTNRTHHTDADAIHRLTHQPEFIGEPVPGGKYIVADDVITTGCTVNALRIHIEAFRGEVVAFTALAGSFSPLTGSSLTIDLTAETLNALETKFGLNRLGTTLRAYGIGYNAGCLTNAQARYILAFRSLDALRTRLAQANHGASLAPTPPRLAIAAGGTQLTLALA